MLKPPRPRLTISIGGMLALVALAAVVIAYLRPAVTRIEEVKVGTGPPVRAGDAVTVHYMGTLADGTKFDSSRDRNAPSTFIVGKGGLIRGWEVGLVGMRRRNPKAHHPARGRLGTKKGPVPPNSTLDFEVELLGIRSAPSAPPGPWSP
ncbi:FKBP-type peptidyl-prolyl cis-trans isomerase [Paludisphaera mucosa]|uniref:Peptidyl-prolyl cis-trans isomerase n=1 Tax=Paludisphaera mucosa TaxID=3030827 RepID=A0ABT6FKV7_9BACT|nr:FKBP-type peptidyl-prolyl cis-trans isomerase [Paludisphaera mucosa]MDG3008206.1 FKBP-type peptidyl-prolyl cis-trans isomerase [Paludisphaera mucosa]